LAAMKTEEESVRFLLIDDDHDDQEIFTMALEGTGDKAGCEAFDNGPDAIEHLQHTEVLPHYIFVDMNMPLMNGRDVLKELKSMERLKEVPVFMYSTSADPNVIAETKELGAAGFIVKPSSLTALTETLIHLLRNRRKA
jgi:CheY-like chemotaxis protein